VSPDAEMELIGEYDEIEIPPVKPYVVRHRRFAVITHRHFYGADFERIRPGFRESSGRG